MDASPVLKCIYDKLLQRYGEPHCSLNFENSYQLFIAVVLSAQCTDERVNKVTPQLFQRYPDIRSFAAADPAELEQIIRPLGFAKVKSNNLLKAAEIVCNQYDCNIPSRIEDLVGLPGFGRKSANVILGNAFAIPGFPVDTHVNRVLNRIGVVAENNPVKIELFVNQHLAPEYWTDLSHLLIIHGRACCQARKPDCDACCMQTLCKKIFK